MTSDATDTQRNLVLELKNQSHPCDMEQLVRLHFSMVYSTCFRITRDRHDAEDAAQAAFLALATEIREKREIRAVGPWLHKVASRASIDVCRRRKRRSNRESASSFNFAAADAPDPCQSADFEEIRPLLLSSLNQLPTKYRLPLILHYFGGLSHAELSKELACTRITLRVRMHRGHKMLRASLKEHGVDLAGGLLGLALSAAVQWQVSQSLLGGAASAGLSTAGYGLATFGASPDLMAAACYAAGHRFSAIKLALIISAIAGGGFAAGAPLLAKLREWQEFPLLPSIQDLSPSFVPTFRAPVPSFSDAGSTPAANATSPALTGGRVQDTLGGIAAVAPAGAAYSSPRRFKPWENGPNGKSPGRGDRSGAAPTGALACATSTTHGSRRGLLNIAPSGAEEFTPKVSCTPGRLPWTAAVDGGPQVTLSAAHAQPSAKIAEGRSEPQQLRDSHSRRPQFARVTPPPGPHANEIWDVINIPASNNSVWQNVQYASTSPQPTSDGVANWVSAGTIASVQSYAVQFSHNSYQINAITNPIYSLNVADLTATGTRDNLSIAGTIPTVFRRVIENNGQVIANGINVSYGATDVIRNTVDDTTVNGWFAAQKGEISLPPIRLTTGAQWHNWGEEESDSSIDLINSLRFGLTAGRDDSLSISLLAADHPAVPALPAGHQFVGIWKATGGTSITGDIDLTVRYDDTLLAAKGLDEQFIKLWYFGDGGWQRATDGFGRNTDLNHVFGHVPVSGFFGVSTPEPSSAAIVIIAGAGGLLRRSRRRRKS